MSFLILSVVKVYIDLFFIYGTLKDKNQVKFVAV